MSSVPPSDPLNMTECYFLEAYKFVVATQTRISKLAQLLPQFLLALFESASAAAACFAHPATPR